MSNDDLVDMIVRQHNAQEIAIKQLKIKSIHKDIIRLKQENRNIGDKVTNFYKHILHNRRERTKFYVCGNGDLSYVYEDRINRDFKTIGYLEKLQMINSRLINKHRSKIKALKKELSAIKGEIK
jgi:hypothetical protein